MKNSTIPRLILLVLLVGSFYGVIYPEQLGMTEQTARVVNAVYLAASLVAQAMEGRNKT